jgi:hypothetical protein
MIRSIKQPLTGLAILLCFVVPVMIALYTWKHSRSTITEQDFRTPHHGYLFTPPIPLKSLKAKLIAIDGHTIFDPRRWHVFYIAQPVCDRGCQTILFDLQQIHLALGRDQPRLQRIILHVNGDLEKPLSPTWQTFYNTHPDWISAALPHDAPMRLLDHTLVLIADPLGNIILSYTTPWQAKDVFADLKKLIRLSHIG